MKKIVIGKTKKNNQIKTIHWCERDKFLIEISSFAKISSELILL